VGARRRVALCLPLIKLEGTVWLVAFLAVVALDRMPDRRRLRVAGCGIGARRVAFVGLLYAFGVFRLVTGGVEIPSLGTFELGWHSVGGAMVASLFTLPNWHLLWYLVPVLLIAALAPVARRSRRGIARPAAAHRRRVPVRAVLPDRRRRWAQDFTSANRLILQIVPSVFVLASVLLRGWTVRRRIYCSTSRTAPERVPPNVAV
jgi:hypothetical protein